MPAPSLSPQSERPPLDTCVQVPSGVYRLGDGGERMVTVDELLIGRWPVTTAEFGAFVASAAHPVGAFLGRRLESAQLADHPVTDVTFADAVAFCAWAARRARPSGSAAQRRRMGGGGARR